MTDKDAYIDVVELCAILQCLGFKVKSLDTSDGNLSQEGVLRTVVVNCQSSGLHVVLESPCATCSCPPTERQNSGFWQVSGVSRGKRADKDSGSAILGSLPDGFRDRITKRLVEMVRNIKDTNDLYADTANVSQDTRDNKSASMVEVASPDKMNLIPKSDMPSRYRSLDTLISREDAIAPGTLQKQPRDLSTDEVKNDKDKDNSQAMCGRQSTYTLSSTPDSARRRNKTSSPIHEPQSTMLDSLIDAKRCAELLRDKLATLVVNCIEGDRNDSSMSSLALDVSKISVLKAGENPKMQFGSSPNLSGIASIRDDGTKSHLKRFESIPTSHLARPSPSVDSKVSKLRRISPFNKLKKEITALKTEKDAKPSKLNSLFRPKIVTPVRVPKLTSESTPNLSAKKKYSHIKSTIPRPTPKKE